MRLNACSSDFVKDTWNPKQPVLNGCLVISNHFLHKDLESSNWNIIYKQMAIRFQVWTILKLEILNLMTLYLSTIHNRLLDHHN